MTVPLPQPGELFEGRYRIEKQVGEGGFSKVFSAMDEHQGIVVALKILTPLDQVEGARQGASAKELADRFLREARILSSLRNPHSIIMYDHGHSQSGHLFMVFEYIKGFSVFEMIRDHGAQTPEAIAHVLEGTLKSLQDAHSQGLLHRDIKPNNLMLAEQSGGTVLKVLDFGIAKAYGDAAGVTPGNDLTAAGVLVGTPRYMPPEQLKGEAVGPAGDIYSLGVVAIEMATGKKAIKGRDRMQVITQQLSPHSLKIPTEIQMPVRLRHIIEKMLAKNPRVRYSSAGEILRDLTIWNTDQPLTAPGGATEPLPTNLAKLGVADHDDKTFVTTVKQAELEAAAQDGATVLQTVNVAELDKIAAAARAKPDTDRTFADPNVAAQLAQELEPTNEQNVLKAPSNWPPPRTGGQGNENETVVDRSGPLPTVDGSGMMPAADRSQPFAADQSGNIPTVEKPKPNLPNNFQNPAHSPAGLGGGVPPAGFGTGEHAAQSRQGEVWDTSGHASLSARQQFQAPVIQSAFELTTPQKAILAVSFFIPGVAHLAFGQTKKGGILLLAIFLTFGIIYVVSLAVVFDAYLCLRAKQKREVGDFELFPDYKDFFS